VHSGGMTKRERQAERRKFWTELIVRHKQSGKTVEAFCQENGVGSPSFYAWRKRLGEKSQPIGFALVETPALRQQRGEPVELILSSGDRLQISPGADAATLRLVLGILREAR
jgi:transposase-like protein